MAIDPILQSFFPGQLLAWLAERSPGPADDVASKSQEMVVLFADLSDFTQLTNEITELQRAGPEAVTELLNGVFGTIIETIGRHGGDVLGFAGDSVLATWSIDQHADRTEALLRAGRCGLDVRDLKLPDAHVEHSDHALRVTVGIGNATLMQVGGVGGQWHFLIGGPPFRQIGQAAGHARPGDVVFSPEAWETARPHIRGRQDGSGFSTIEDLDILPPAAPAPLPELSPETGRAVQGFLSSPVVARIEAGQSDWLAERRRVTSVFVNLPAVDVSQAASRDALQDVTRVVQRSMATYEGTLSRIVADDKGVTLINAFGLPPFTHEEDPYLAIQAAEEIREALVEMKLEFGIGIATGRAYCGAYGSPTRRDYTTIGREVNLAARLMQAARFEILCDEATARAARRFEFHALEPLHIKGWDSPVPTFRPLWERVLSELEDHVGGSLPLHLVGRDAERRHLTSSVEEIRRLGGSGVFVVEGGAGMGKTVLAADLVAGYESSDVRTLVGAALPVAQAPYQAWRDVFGELLGLTGVGSAERRQEIVQDRLARLPQFAQREALLNSVLGLQFPETESTWSMSGRNRLEWTVELLTTLLADAAAQAPLLIVLDDTHWLDSASWAVVLAAARKVEPMLLVLLTRPQLDPPDELEQLAGVDGFTRLVLHPIDQHESLELAQDRLEARDLAPEVAELIVGGAEGIPFFVEELAYSLRDSGALAVSGGLVTLRRSAKQIDVPHSLSSVVLSRIDRLPPQHQLTVKVASVIGRRFGVDTLAAVHPGHPTIDELTTELTRLTGLELIVEIADGLFDFKHALIRDAAYDLLLFDQRRQIHRAIAAFIESSGEEAEPPHALLAYHWDRAEDPRKALAYLEKTGASSLRKGANREAIEAYARTVELLRDHREKFEEVTPLRRSQWYVEMGQAQEALGQLDQAEASWYESLDLLGVHVSKNPIRRLGRLLWEVTKQAVHIFLPGTIRVPASDEEKVRLAQAARAASLIGEVYYFTGNIGGFLVVNLTAINLGERAGDPIFAGLAYSSLGYLVGTMRLRRLAARYFRRARAAEEHELTGSSVQTPDTPDLYEMAPGHLIAVSLSESVLALTFNEWDRAREVVTEGMDRCDQLGESYSAGIALAIRGFGSYSTGHLEEALHDFHRLLMSARERANREHEGWATSFVTPVLLALGRDADAQEMAIAGTAILDNVDPLTVPIIHGTRSQVYLQDGRFEEALASAEAALAAFDRTPAFIYLAGFHGMLDTLLELWAREEPGSERAAKLTKLTKQGLKMIRTFALVLPFARPRYRLFRGRMEYLQGRATRAQRTLRKGLEIAEGSGFKWDEGLLHLELARTLPTGSVERQGHLDRARKRFAKAGSVRDLQRTDALIE